MKISALMRTEGSTRGARPDADRQVWEPLKKTARASDNVVGGVDARALRRRVERAARKDAHREQVKARGFARAIRRAGF